MLSERLRTYRDQVYARAAARADSLRRKNWTTAFFELYRDRPLPERQARSFAWALANEPVYLQPLERLAGQLFQGLPNSRAVEVSGDPDEPRWNDSAVGPVAERRVREALPENAQLARFFGGGAFPGHIGWDFGRILEHGTDGLLLDVAARALATAEPDAKAFYQGVTISLQALAEWAERHVIELGRAAEREPDPARQAELLEMAEICQKVPHGPAATFREAVQSFLFQHLAVMYENPFGGNSPGRLDYYLWPYLEADLAAARTTESEAYELVIELLLKLHERLGPSDGWVEAVMVGGRHRDGSSSVNPLSSMILRGIMELEQTHPSVYVRLHDDAPPEFRELAVRYLVEGGNRGQVYGDDAVIEAMVDDGVAIEDARHWTAGGCMEVSPQGCQADLLFSFSHNVARTFELVLNGGCLLQSSERAIELDRALPDYADFEELYTTFETELRRELRILLKRLDIYLGAYAECRPSFLLSSMVDDCLERGRSLNAGGARYSTYGGSGLGMPNVADSLTALKLLVYDQQRFTADEVLAALRSNFAGHERLRQALLAAPKYGNDDAVADAMLARVLQSFTGPLKAHRNPYGDHAKAVILGFTWVVSYGQQTGALPDGRLAGTPLAHGLAPQTGAARRGITSALLSATELDLKQVAGGASMMWDLDPALAQPEHVGPLLQCYLDRGGHIFQGNTVDIPTLRQAQETPESYPHLMVRVGGYSARFVALSKATQDEIIARQRHRAAP